MFEFDTNIINYPRQLNLSKYIYLFRSAINSICEHNGTVQPKKFGSENI